ncbi:ABC transporter permease [Lysinibacillus sp. KU-BSD001]|uniref:ABC transporter permease n=1 Tax=Lysinibacillus sp. KU-BSD001 TaxID=3141328 RepID=UPI0036E41152
MKYVKNEWMKLWAKKSSWVMLIIMLLLVVGPAAMMKYYDEPVNDNWKETLQQENAEYQNMLQDETLTAQDKVYFQELLLMNEYRMEQNIPPQMATTIDSFMNFELSLSRMFITIFAVVVAAGIVSSEFSTGTIKMLLTRPVARWKILLSKLVTTIFYGLFIYGVTLAFSALVGVILWGTTASTPLEVVDGVVKEVNVWGNYFEMLALSFSDFFMSIFLAFMIGSVFSSSSLAVGLTLFISFMGATVVMLLSKYEIAKYIWITHTDLTQYATGSSPIIEGLTLSFSLTMNVIYAVLFLVITFTFFMKRDVTA